MSAIIIPMGAPSPSPFAQYLQHGWKLVPIPPGSKGPNTTGWNLPENTLKSADDLPAGYGVGLLHSLSGTMAFDIDDGDATRQAVLRAER